MRYFDSLEKKTVKNNQVTIVLSSGLGHWAFSDFMKSLIHSGQDTVSCIAQFTPLYRLSKLEETKRVNLSKPVTFWMRKPRIKMLLCGCLVAQLCLTLCSPMDCSLPGSSVYRLPQARTLEWAATSSPRDLAEPGIEPRSPALQVDCLLLSHWGSR